MKGGGFEGGESEEEERKEDEQSADGNGGLGLGKKEMARRRRRREQIGELSLCGDLMINALFIVVGEEDQEETHSPAIAALALRCKPHLFLSLSSFPVQSNNILLVLVLLLLRRLLLLPKIEAFSL